MEPAKKQKTDEEAKAPVVRHEEGEINPEYLKIYYDRLFPVSLMYQWLSYGDPELIKRREFSFTLKDDVYIRYCSFKSKEEFKAALVAKVPYKIDIGAVFNGPPNMHDSITNFKPVSKEFVIDIDMTDYDVVRTCCKGADICIRCWPLMICALKVIEFELKQEFGFRHLLWVYSGRRGIHCWVCDQNARMLSDQARTAVTEYLSVYLGNEKNHEQVLRAPVHPMLQEAYELLLPRFEELIESQGLMDGDRCDKLIDRLGFEFEADRNEFLFTQDELDRLDGVEKWRRLVKKVDKKLNQNHVKKQFAGLKVALMSIVFNYCYPRLDINVSRQLNHLLKAPFCVHPKTGKVCVPINPEKADEFSPFEVPTLNGLYQEINQLPVETPKQRCASLTSMRKHLEFFGEFVQETWRDGQREAPLPSDDW